MFGGEPKVGSESFKAMINGVFKVVMHRSTSTLLLQYAQITMYSVWEHMPHTLLHILRATNQWLHVFSSTLRALVLSHASGLAMRHAPPAS